jgi:hypothetical protein
VRLFCHFGAGANTAIVSYNASAAKIVNATACANSTTLKFTTTTPGL